MSIKTPAEEKTKAQLLQELETLRAEVAVLEGARGTHHQAAEDRRLRAIVEATMDFVGFAAPDGHVLYLNKAARQAVGLTDDVDLTQMTIPDFHPQWTNEMLSHEGLPRAIREGVWRGEGAWLHRDGHEILTSMVIHAHKAPNGEVEFLSTISHDITEYKRTEEELQLFRDLINRTNDAIFVVDPETSRFLDINEKACSSLGYTREELLQMGAVDIEAVIPDRFSWEAHVKEVQRHGFMILEGAHKRKDGTTFVVEINVSFVAQDRQKYMVAVVRDITERKQAEEKLRATYVYLDTILLNLPAGVAILEGPDLRYFRINHKLADINGLPVEDHLGRPLAEVLPDAAPDILPRLQNVMKTGESALNHEFSTRLPNNPDQPRHFIDSFFPIKGVAGKPMAVGAVVLDITERKQAEEELKRSEEQLKVSLKEKELLLNEVHHRVKNNLQLVSSLLNLQAASIKDPQVRAYFQDSQDRVRAMALIHQRLSESKDFARVGFAEYIRSLTAHLVRSFGLGTQAVAVKVSADVVPLGVDQAIQCGLIINELVSNALKHAFPAGRLGEIRVDVHEDRNGRVVLRVSDDGIGLPAGIEIKDAETLGLTLVATLTEQLRGTIKMDGQGGTAVTVTFPLQSGREQRR